MQRDIPKGTTKSLDALLNSALTLPTLLILKCSISLLNLIPAKGGRIAADIALNLNSFLNVQLLSLEYIKIRV